MNKLFVFLAFLVLENGFSQDSFPYNVKLNNISGNNIQSIELGNSGKPFILEFFRTDCKPCINLLNSFKEVHYDWKKKYEVKIIVIVVDKKVKKKRLIKMKEKYNWPFEFYFDYNKELFNALKSANVLPYTIIFDNNYSILSKINGVKSNYGFKIINGKISNEKIKINKKGKYNNLECDLMRYEKILIRTLTDIKD